MEPCNAQPPAVVTVSYDQIKSQADLAHHIESAFGPDGLGLILISGVPQFPECRSQLLPLANSFAALPEDVKALYEDEKSSYSFGWSHGKEALQPGVKDTFKGSYYANPVCDAPCDDPALAEQHPTYFRENIWPREHLPQLEGAFKGLGGLVVDVGMSLAEHCDRYVHARNPAVPQGHLVRVLRDSRNHKARLLHYFPTQPAKQHQQQEPQPLSPAASNTIDATATVQLLDTSSSQQHAGSGTSGVTGAVLPSPAAPLAPSPSKSAAASTAQPPSSSTAAKSAELDHNQSWCGWHTDHGSLTGLTSAMYIDSASGREVANPDPTSGLYARARSGEVVKVAIPPNTLAFQLGEAMQVHSGGLLRATPHYVRAATAGDACAGISRNTFAVFMQPGVFERMDAPAGVADDQVAVGQWRRGQDFGAFSEETIKRYYS